MGWGKKTIAAVVAAFAFFFGVSDNTRAEPADDPAQVISQAAALHSSVESYTFNVRLHIALHTFPWAKFRLHGTGAYQKNGPYVLDIDNMPGFAKSYGHVSLAYLDPQTWSKDYTMSVASRSGDTVVLALHDRKKSPLTEALATFNLTSGLQEIVWHYNYGGVVRLTFTPDKTVGHALPAAMDADVVMPQYHASAHADFSDYHVVSDGNRPPLGTQTTPPADVVATPAPPSAFVPR